MSVLISRTIKVVCGGPLASSILLKRSVVDRPNCTLFVFSVRGRDSERQHLGEFMHCLCFLRFVVDRLELVVNCRDDEMDGYFERLMYSWEYADPEGFEGFDVVRITSIIRGFVREGLLDLFRRGFFGEVMSLLLLLLRIGVLSLGGGWGVVWFQGSWAPWLARPTYSRSS